MTKPRFHRRELWQNRSFCKETVHRVKHHTVIKSALLRRFCARKLRSASHRSQRFRAHPHFRLAFLRTRAPARSQQQLASSILLPQQQLRSMLARVSAALCPLAARCWMWSAGLRPSAAVGSEARPARPPAAGPLPRARRRRGPVTTPSASPEAASFATLLREKVN